MLTALILIAVLLAGDDPTPAPSPEPTEIGRVRASVPACSVLSGLVAPSVAAAVKSDERFVQTAVDLAQYIRIIDDPWDKGTAARPGTLSKIERAASAMLQDALTINRALGDPRVAADVNDPDVLAERAQLQQVYATQMARASVLIEFVQRERMSMMRANSGMYSEDTSHPTSPPAPVLDQQVPAPVFGQPHLQGIEFSDKQQINDWTKAITTSVNRSESSAMRALQKIIANCHP